MKHRNPIAIVLLTFITLGIYGVVWQVKTKNEMNRLGAQIPTAWLLIIPLVNIWWLWKYSEGVEHVTGNKLSAVLAFILAFLLGIIGMAVIQLEFNKVDAAPSPIVPDVPMPPSPVTPAEATPVVPTEPAAQPVTNPEPPVASPVPTPVEPVVTSAAPTEPVVSAPLPTEPIVVPAPESQQSPQTPPTRPVQ